MALTNEFAIFLGAFIYPKDMDSSISIFNKYSKESDILDAGTIYDLLHKTLYNFSNHNLNELINKSKAF
jgi:hypothetical protein